MVDGQLEDKIVIYKVTRGAVGNELKRAHKIQKDQKAMLKQQKERLKQMHKDNLKRISSAGEAVAGGITSVVPVPVPGLKKKASTVQPEGDPEMTALAGAVSSPRLPGACDDNTLV